MKTAKIFVLFAVGALAFAACDGDDEGGSDGASTAAGTANASESTAGDDVTDPSGATDTAGDAGDAEETAAADDTTGAGDTAGDAPMTDDGDPNVCDPACAPGEDCVAGTCLPGEPVCGAGMCGACADINECVMCAQGMGAECAAQNAACNANPACNTILMCSNACGMDQACATQCETDNPEGVEDFNGLIDCIVATCA